MTKSFIYGFKILNTKQGKECGVGLMDKSLLEENNY